MNNISLKSIKFESIKSIFLSIVSADSISRSAISQETSLSLVTVGKIADALLDLDIVTQDKPVRQQAGRRAGILQYNKKKYAIILDLTTTQSFILSVFDLRLEQLCQKHYTYQNDRTCRENLELFLHEMSLYAASHFDPADCFGVGVAVPGPYDSTTDLTDARRHPELSAIPLHQTIAKHFSAPVLLIDSHINAAAQSNMLQVPDYEDKNIVYWYVSATRVCGAYLAKGELILGKGNQTCDFGSMRHFGELTLDDKISLCVSPMDAAEALCPPIHNIIRLLCPHTMMMEFDLPFPCDEIIPRVCETLSVRYRLKPSEMPDIINVCSGYRNSHRGLTMRLRNLFLEKIVFDNSL